MMLLLSYPALLSHPIRGVSLKRGNLKRFVILSSLFALIPSSWANPKRVARGSIDAGPAVLWKK